MGEGSEETLQHEVNSEGVEWWRVGYGDYSKHSITSLGLEGKEPEKNLTIEGFIGLIIKRRIEERRVLLKGQEGLSVPPVIVMDFGSTQAHSFVRLAIEFEEQIKSGELILVCSNLSHRPNKEVEAKKWDGYEGKNIADVNEMAVPGYYEKCGLIDWVNGRASDLESARVSTQDGRSFPLMGNVALINERNVFEHIEKDAKTKGAFPLLKARNTVFSLKKLLDVQGLIVSSDMPRRFVNYSSPLLDSYIRIYSKDNKILKFYEWLVGATVLRHFRERVDSLRKHTSIPEGLHMSDEEIREVISEEERKLKEIQDYVSTQGS